MNGKSAGQMPGKEIDELIKSESRDPEIRNPQSAIRSRKIPSELKRFLIKVQGGKEYLPAAYRIAWFREECPEWGIDTAVIEGGQEAGFAMVRAYINNEEGRVISTGHKTETRADFPAGWVEKAECVPLTTRILTRRGWGDIDDLSIGEDVLTYDIATDKAEWAPVERMVIYRNSPVTRLWNGWGFDVTCTPEHKWVYIHHRGKRELREAGNLPRSGLILTASPGPSGTLGVTPQQAAIMGWLQTDGNFRRKGKCLRAYICQSKPKRVKEIDALLEGVECYRDVSKATLASIAGNPQMSLCLPQVRWNFSAQFMRELYAAFEIDHEADIESAVPHLTSDARAAMLEAMLHADADARGTFGKRRKPWVMDTFGVLCALQGIALPRRTFSTAGQVPQQRLKKTCRTHLTNVQREDAGVTDVWCPSTKHGTWYAQFENGVVTLTGNTGAISRALINAGFGSLYSGDEDASDERLQPDPGGAARVAGVLRGNGEQALGNGHWEGPGQCPRCHAPEGKRHGKPCVS